jgi:hypothetical protein
MKAVISVVAVLAVCWFYVCGSNGPSAAQAPAWEGQPPPTPTDVAPFQSRLNRAEEYGVEPVASGHVFGAFDRHAFLFRLGGPDCSAQWKCLYVLFRNAQDDFPFVTFCAAGRYETGHAHTAGSRNVLYRFELVCEKAKFQIHLSPMAASVTSYVDLD